MTVYYTQTNFFPKKVKDIRSNMKNHPSEIPKRLWEQ